MGFKKVCPSWARLRASPLPLPSTFSRGDLGAPSASPCSSATGVVAPSWGGRARGRQMRRRNRQLGPRGRQLGVSGGGSGGGSGELATKTAEAATKPTTKTTEPATKTSESPSRNRQLKPRNQQLKTSSRSFPCGIGPVILRQGSASA